MTCVPGTKVLELTDLPPLIRVSMAAEFIGCDVGDIYDQAGVYLARMEALVAKDGPIPHDDSRAFPLRGERAAVRVSEPTLCRDGKRRGGRYRLYRDYLLWQLYGVLDYGRERAS